MYSENELARAREVIAKMASKKGTSEEAVRQEMIQAIEAGYSNDTPATRDEWSKAPFSGRRPTPEEFILWCSSRIKE